LLPPIARVTMEVVDTLATLPEKSPSRQSRWIVVLGVIEKCLATGERTLERGQLHVRLWRRTLEEGRVPPGQTAERLRNKEFGEPRDATYIRQHIQREMLDS